jgi:hypothetical protein
MEAVLRFAQAYFEAQSALRKNDRATAARLYKECCSLFTAMKFTSDRVHLEMAHERLNVLYHALRSDNPALKDDYSALRKDYPALDRGYSALRNDRSSLRKNAETRANDAETRADAVPDSPVLDLGPREMLLVGCFIILIGAVLLFRLGATGYAVLDGAIEVPVQTSLFDSSLDISLAQRPVSLAVAGRTGAD